MADSSRLEVPTYAIPWAPVQRPPAEALPKVGTASDGCHWRMALRSNPGAPHSEETLS